MCRTAYVGDGGCEGGAAGCKTALRGGAHVFFELLPPRRLGHLFLRVLLEVRHLRLHIVEAHHDALDHLLVLHLVHRVLEVVEPEKGLREHAVVARGVAHLQRRDARVGSWAVLLRS